MFILGQNLATSVSAELFRRILVRNRIRFNTGKKRVLELGRLELLLVLGVVGVLESLLRRRHHHHIVAVGDCCRVASAHGLGSKVGNNESVGSDFLSRHLGQSTQVDWSRKIIDSSQLTRL